MTYLEKEKLSNERRLKRQKWGVRRYVSEDGRLTEEGKTRYLTMDQIKSINSAVEQLANETDERLHENGELKDWQWEIMLQNESDDENRE